MSRGKTVDVKDFILSRQPDKALAEMVQVFDRLRVAIEEENIVLAACDARRFIKIKDRKAFAAADYHSGMRQLIQRKHEFQGMQSHMRAHILAMEMEFRQLSTRNLELIGRMLKSAERLGARVKHATIEAVRRRAPNYGAGGSLTETRRPVSMSLNRSA